MIPLIIAICIIVILIAAIWGTYNSMVRLNERVEEAWHDITVQLQYRADLIPNVTETVKGYAKHEKDVFEEIAKARSASISAKGVDNVAAADKSLTGALSRIMAIAEAYPELKANANFQQLQTQLQDVEDKLQAARRFYNAGAKEMNTKIKMFPSNIINKMVGHFKERKYFEVDTAEQERIAKAPQVKFD